MTFRTPTGSAPDVIATLAQELADLQTLADYQASIIAEAWAHTTADDPNPAGLPAQMDADNRERRAALGAWDDESESVAECIERVVAEADKLSDIADALRAYLVSIGLPSDPITFDSPELRALAEALL